MSKKGNLIIFSGPSGVGKGTIREELFKDKSLNLTYSISATSRLPRPGEQNGVHYFFITKDEFENRIENGEFLEHAQFVGNYYGTPKDYVEKLINEGKNVMLEIETQGALQVMDKVPEALSIFILPPSLEELESRIRGRGTEANDVVESRLNTAKEELKLKDKYMYNVVNHDIKQAADEIAKIIRKHM